MATNFAVACFANGRYALFYREQDEFFFPTARVLVERSLGKFMKFVKENTSLSDHVEFMLKNPVMFSLHDETSSIYGFFLNENSKYLKIFFKRGFLEEFPQEYDSEMLYTRLIFNGIIGAESWPRFILDDQLGVILQGHLAVFFNNKLIER